jgi:hypothetical protein
VSYEGSPADQASTYLAERLIPLQPVILWGRTAATVPSVSIDTVLFYWWRVCWTQGLGY